jgi:hypothetical protein
MWPSLLVLFGGQPLQGTQHIRFCGREVQGTQRVNGWDRELVQRES